MTRSRAQRMVLLAMALVIPLSYLGVERHDGRWFVEVNGRPVDVMGHIDQAWTSWWRDCRAVQTAPEPAVLASALQVVRDFSPPDSRSGRWLSVQQQGPWLLAQVRFERLHDAVVLLNTATPAPEVKAVWSGYTHPNQPESWIRRHLRAQTPEAPSALLACFAFQAKPDA